MKTIDRLLDWLDRRTGLQNMGLLFLAGAATGLSFAPYYLFPVLVLSYPLLLRVLFKATHLMVAFSLGWWFGFGQFLVGLIWIAAAFDVDARYSGTMGYLAVACLALVLAVFPGIAMAIFWRIFRHKNPQSQTLCLILSFVIFWNLAEWVRGHIFTGFPWNLAGYAWGFSDVMLQTTALWGIYGLGLLTVFLALVPYGVMQNLHAKKSPRTIIVMAVFMLGGMGIYGMVQLSNPTKFQDEVTLKIIQANISQQDKWDPEKKADNFLKHLRMSKSQPEDGITHVIWPETAVIYFLDTEPSRRFLIADMLGDDTQLMTGFPRVQRSPEFRAWNSFAIVDGKGDVRHIYDKHHLVPFGEYVPSLLRGSLSFLGLGMLVEGFSYSRGDGLRTLHGPDMPPVGVLICYEIIFPGAVVDGNNRPDWLLNITNDAWYGSFSGPYQHFLQTRVRAIEEGLPIVRSAGTGISAVIDPYGRVIKVIDLNKQGVIISPLPAKREDQTPYSKNNSLFFWGLVILFSGFSILFRRQ